MEKYPFSFFSKYVEGNKTALTGLGIIASIAALFLNLDQSVFGESLRNLQLLLVLFLLLGLIFLTIDSLFWFKDNADSWFSGLITFSLGLVAWRIWEFILDNFRNELNKYLLLIYISVTFLVYAFFIKIKKKAELDIDKRISAAFLKAISYGFITFLFLYLPNVLLRLYSDFAQNKELSTKILFGSFSGSFVWSFSVWVAVTEFCISFFLTKERARLWLSIFLLSLLGISLLIILWPTILDLIFALK